MRLSADLSPGRTLVTDVDETLAACGRALLAELVPAARELPDGGEADVEVAWAAVRLRAAGDHVCVEEPDYSHDPSRFTSSLSNTCQIAGLQRELLRRVGADGDDVTANQYVRASSGAMQSISVVGHRHRDMAPFTGWQIVSAGTTDPEGGEYGQYTVRELAAHRLAWIVALALPAGWAFRCVGNTIVDAVSPQRRTHELKLSVDI
jgi:hypothetical protein